MVNELRKPLKASEVFFGLFFLGGGRGRYSKFDQIFIKVDIGAK